ncbi:MAG TPA: hypothetical protein VFR47_21400 [Anaerolineales bacterium]|nr:hypothetical protein [Anaerolineales bacterium]
MKTLLFSSQPLAIPMSFANIGRILWGLFFIASSLFNLFITLPNPDFYRAFADINFFGFYRWLLLNIALPYATVITSLVVIFELTVGMLILTKGIAVRYGLMGTCLWLLFICPSMGWYTIWSPILLVVPFLLLRFDY